MNVENTARGEVKVEQWSAVAMATSPKGKPSCAGGLWAAAAGGGSISARPGAHTHGPQAGEHPAAVASLPEENAAARVEVCPFTCHVASHWQLHLSKRSVCTTAAMAKTICGRAVWSRDSCARKGGGRGLLQEQ